MGSHLLIDERLMRLRDELFQVKLRLTEEKAKKTMDSPDVVDMLREKVKLYELEIINTQMLRPVE